MLNFAQRIYAQLSRSARTLTSHPTSKFAPAAPALMWAGQHPAHPEASPSPFTIRRYEPLHTSWPYAERDFDRADKSDDGYFYQQPRYVAHIDDAALSRLTAYYHAVVPRKGRVLDLCTSWQSWYSPECEQAAVKEKTLEVYGIGLNEAELSRNLLFSGFPERAMVLNLNEEPHDINAKWPLDASGQRNPPTFDCVTCTVSIDYLTHPLEILKGIRECMSDGGRIHLAISNRCFHTKVVKIWMRLSEQERLQLVGDYLHFSGWRDVEIVDLCAKDEKGGRVTDDRGLVYGGVEMGDLLEGHLDPLWVVRGTAKH